MHLLPPFVVGLLVGSAFTLALPESPSVWVAITAVWALVLGLIVVFLVAANADRKLSETAEQTRTRQDAPRESSARPRAVAH